MNLTRCSLLVLGLTLVAPVSFAQEQPDPKLILKDGGALDTATGEYSDKTIDFAPGSITTIDPATGSLIVEPEVKGVCAATSNDCAAVDVVVNDFSVPATVEEGGIFTTTLRSRGAFECRRTGLPGSDWQETTYQDPIDLEGSISVPLGSAAPDTYELRYECRNGGEEVFAAATLEITEADTEPPPPSDLPAECTGWANDGDPTNDLRPAAWTQDFTPIFESSSAGIDTWPEFFGDAFPGKPQRTLAINKDQYVALRFDASGMAPGTKLSLNFSATPPGDGPNGPYVVTMSRCPGDFRPDLGFCRQFANNLIFTNDQNDPLSTCKIPTSGTMYLNIAFSTDDNFIDLIGGNDPADLIWTCGGETECTSLIN